MSRKRRSHDEGHEEAEGGMERWLLTYADMITLLLALFIVLFAVSSINSKKFLALALGLHKTFDPNPGVLSSGTGLLNQPSLTPAAGPQQAAPKPNINPLRSFSAPTTTTTAPQQAGSQGQTSLATIEAQLNHALVAKGLAQLAVTTVTQRELIVQILADRVFFATDSATIGPVGDQVVDTIASVLRTDANAVIVEGYTDNQPVLGGPYFSNMELSAVRAVDIVQRLSAADGLNENRLAAIGYGQSHPAEPNDTPAHMAENRRIDVVILGPGQSTP
jgi:chemotaxis protein MotB